ncbi:acyltransferase [Bradyrhizobium septentrionale]|uniref:Acyltransferase n=1 Tax=Bradyrhizobium septentrionale TaxID=1404411 RepID=A0ABZ2P3K3_9BRAD
MQQTSGSSEHSRVPALDFLRLLAVGAVILYHYGFWGPASHGAPQVALPILGSIAQYGFLGVPVFFAISGFVIAYSAEGRTPLNFAIARFSRIYPTFVFCMTLTFVAIIAFGADHFEVTAQQWFANLFIAAPVLGQSYIDTSYWSLVIEVIFYAWVAVFMALGLYPRRIDEIIVVWIAITFANELTIDAPIFEKLFIADHSGFFVVGLLIYQYHRGRRDARLWALSALAMGTAVFQALHNQAHLGVLTGSSRDPIVVAAICVVSLCLVYLATRIKRIPISATIVMAAGGITYPLYLLHMQLGYVVLTALGPIHHVALATTATIVAIIALSVVVWRFFERPAHKVIRLKLTEFADKLGFASQQASATTRQQAAPSVAAPRVR